MSRLARLSALVFLLVGLTQLTLMFGPRLGAIDELLSRNSWIYLPVAILCWLFVLVGLAVETHRGPL